MKDTCSSPSSFSQRSAIFRVWRPTTCLWVSLRIAFDQGQPNLLDPLAPLVQDRDVDGVDLLAAVRQRHEPQLELHRVPPRVMS
jgi:hypothetical protein